MIPYSSYLSVDWQASINWQSPFNKGLRAWFLNAPHVQGSLKWKPIFGDFDAALTNMETADWIRVMGIPLDSGGWGSLLTDGANEHVTVTDHANLDITDEITLICSMCPASNVAFSSPIFKGSSAINYGMDCGSDGLKLRFFFTSGGNNHFYEVTNVFTINVVRWYKIAVSFRFGTGSSIAVVVDGKQLTGSWTLGSGNAVPAANTDPLVFGRNGTSGAIYWNGLLDDIRILNTYMSAPMLSELQKDSDDYKRQALRRWIRVGKKSGAVFLPPGLLQSGTLIGAI